MSFNWKATQFVGQVIDHSDRGIHVLLTVGEDSKLLQVEGVVHFNQLLRSVVPIARVKYPVNSELTVTIRDVDSDQRLITLAPVFR